ncbi:hypothetical protein BpHYR1_054506 [Brachionus plicatilis]|uniref:Uncharacterized protein n=1 Tax=Brachionus plicatilis TaxID=10195 RepID=A0A3M7R2L1_BRAPC|nr:hypothetical protein BpHYR1_054506 [Brachionus plicatilis]
MDGRFVLKKLNFQIEKFKKIRTKSVQLLVGGSVGWTDRRLGRTALTDGLDGRLTTSFIFFDFLRSYSPRKIKPVIPSCLNASENKKLFNALSIIIVISQTETSKIEYRQAILVTFH